MAAGVEEEFVDIDDRFGRQYYHRVAVSANSGLSLR